MTHHLILSLEIPKADGPAQVSELCHTCAEGAAKSVCPLAPRAELLAAFAEVQIRLNRGYYYDGWKADKAESGRLFIALWRKDVQELPWLAEHPDIEPMWTEWLMDEVAELRG
ncbi:hypothetical protein F7Q99_36125 [Streptomyces kaniharaensis]|uniref:Uncharacterized protein n=1 Tax=Streptomyces kaniharaensis TaxID=212423 RepID=A0A6N7L153_9ACTN|nr:hypothetical protein [Streptomyces kaniharaensis]MQS17470.1 hypothetical protein [Streptomyces kaniharaensis]